MKIKDRLIGLDENPLVIAEIGINHGGSLEIAKLMVDAAFEAGIEMVKHQTHIVEDEMIPIAKTIIPGNSEKSIYKIMSECALNEEDEFSLMRYVESKGMLFISTPFSRKAVDRLVKFNVPAFKIGSGECNNFPLLEYIASIGKPIILSTGMNSMEDIEIAVGIIEKYNVPYALLHTTNLYPTPNKLVRLGALNDLKEKFPNIPIGLSDHTVSNHACFAATALGASILERHFTDSMDRVGPDIVCSMDISAAKDLIKGSKIIAKQRGGSKTITREEQVTRDFAFASLCTIEEIKKGQVFSNKNIWVKRPGKGGIHAKEFFSIVGKKAATDIPKDVQLKPEHIL